MRTHEILVTKRGYERSLKAAKKNFKNGFFVCGKNMLEIVRDPRGVEIT